METEQTNAAPAGASEPMSLSAAAGLLATLEDKDTAPANEPVVVQAESTTGEGAEPSAEPAEGTEEAPEATASEEDADPAPEAESEPDPEPDQYAHGNARTRLRDGTVTTVGELKKLAEEAKELKARVPDLTAAQQQLAQKAQAIAQQEQLFSRTLPLALQVMRSQVPPPPDPSLLQSDPIAHYEQMVAHQEARNRLHQLEQADAARQQQAALQKQAELQDYLAQQRTQLLSKIPELNSDETRKEVYSGFQKTAEKYGFTSEEVDQVYDHRLLHMVHDLTSQNAKLAQKAAAYDKLLAQKPVAEKKAAAATPVQQPGRRVTSTEVKTQQRQDLIQRAKSSGGRLTDIASILANFE